MRLIPIGLEVEVSPVPEGNLGPGFSAAPHRYTKRWSGSREVLQAGPLEVRIGSWPPASRPPQSTAGTTIIPWSVANASGSAIRVHSVALIYQVPPDGPLRMLRHGYQSWSPTDIATLGVDHDPSLAAGSEFMQAVHHADQRQALQGDLRSEWFTLLSSGNRTGSGLAAGARTASDPSAGDPSVTAACLVGALGGSEHDTTLRLRATDEQDEGAELRVEAYLGGAVFAPAEQRHLHPVWLDERDVPATEKLATWADQVGSAARALTQAPFQVGWCSWYQYFHDISEESLASNLALAGSWPFDLFQLDDGYQRAIGDWLDTNDKFPSGLEALAASVAAEGRLPGLWLAPFLAAPDSEVVRRNGEWVARYDQERPLRTWWNPSWGGGHGGFMYGLDTTHPDVQAHLTQLAADLVAAGWRYLKLDFTFSPSVDGHYFDPSMTPAQRVRCGYEAIRRGAGDDVFVLGCGVPLANVVGLVDGNRIGQDVAPLWDLGAEATVVPGYLGVQPATRHAYSNTAARSFMHRRLWLNDPDCVMLRSTDTQLSQEAARTWALAVGVSGGMVIVSDDLALLGSPERHLLDEVLALGRASDAGALAGRTAMAPDVPTTCPPRLLQSDHHRLEVEPLTGASKLTVL